MDSIFSIFGIYIFYEGVTPLWLGGLWVMFSLAIPHAFGFLRGRYFLAGLLAMVSAPFTYFSGLLLREDAELAEPYMASLLMMALAWSIYFPLIYYVLAKVERS